MPRHVTLALSRIEPTLKFHIALSACKMAEVIDLTVSPRPEIIEISSDHENNSPGRCNRTQENKKRKRKKEKTSNSLATGSDSAFSSSAQPTRAHSPEIGDKHSDINDSSVPCPKSASQALPSVSSSIIGEPGLFFLDGAPAPIAVEDITSTPEPTDSNGDGNKLLLPSHVAIFHDDGPIPTEVIPPPKLSSDDEEYIEYLDYEDRKVSSVTSATLYTS